jgi:hypothetical protein
MEQRGGVISKGEAKRLGTLRSRQKFFYHFVVEILKIDDPCLSRNSREGQQHVLFMFMWAVGAGYSLRRQLVRADTVKQYGLAAGEMISECNGNCGNPLYEPSGGMASDCYKVVKDLQDWQDLPNRVEPVTKEMVEFMWKDKGLTDEDSDKALIRDFSVFGLCATGFRSAEWNQDKKVRRGKFDRKGNSKTGPILALMEGDLQFFTPDHKVIAEPCKVDPSQIGYVKVTHRVQKNGANGQKITHAANHGSHHFCPVRAAVRIVARANRLGVRADEPLAAFKQNEGSQEPTWVTKQQVAKYFTAVAKIVYDIPETTKVRYSGHSLRVGAAVLMYSGGALGMHIKQRLRWKSDTFMTYLRDVPQAAIQHLRQLNETVNEQLPSE